MNLEKRPIIYDDPLSSNDEFIEMLASLSKTTSEELVNGIYEFFTEYYVEHQNLAYVISIPRSILIFTASLESLLLAAIQENSSSAVIGAAYVALASGYFCVSQKKREADHVGKNLELYLKEHDNVKVEAFSKSMRERIIHWDNLTNEYLDSRIDKYISHASSDRFLDKLTYVHRMDHNQRLFIAPFLTIGEHVNKLKSSQENFCIGEVIQNISLNTLENKQIELRRRQDKPLLVFIWSGECGTCIDKLKKLALLRHELDRLNIDVLTINVDKNPQALQKQLKSQEIYAFNTAYTHNQANIMQDWGIIDVPMFALIDSAGVIRTAGSYDLDRIVLELELLAITNKENSTQIHEHSSVGLMKNFSKSMANWALSGMKQADQELVTIRLSTCQTCPHLIKNGTAFLQKLVSNLGLGDAVCNLCGCAVNAKAKILNEDCPSEAAINGVSPWKRAERGDIQE